ncbi:hypothetical protein GCM10009738_09300 [Kitasatospora viridis]
MSSGPTLQEFTALCADILGVPELAPESNFFDEGGDSISAARLAVELDERWELQIDMFEIFTAANIHELHSGMSEALSVE